MNTPCMFGHEEADQDPEQDVYEPYDAYGRLATKKFVYCKHCRAHIGTYYDVKPPSDIHNGILLVRTNIFEPGLLWQASCWCTWQGCWNKQKEYAQEALDEHLRP